METTEHKLPTWLSKTQREFIAAAAEIPQEELDRFRIHVRGPDTDDEGEGEDQPDLEVRDRERKESLARRRQ